MSELLAELQGGVAVVTGAGSGIGEAIARQAAAAGMKVVLADIDEGRVKAVAASIETAGGTALAAVTDVADAAALDQLAALTHQAFGDVRLLVNNAGIEVLGHAWEISATTWKNAMAVNVLGVVHGVRAFMPRMLASGLPAFIANLSSVGGLGMMPDQAPYIMSKHAVLSFTECLALEVELTGKPISVSAVLPGPVATRIFDDAPAGDNLASVERHREFMRAMLREHGMDLQQAGRLILEGIAARRFWVSTHPDMLADAARGRSDYLRDLQRPALTPAARTILGI